MKKFYFAVIMAVVLVAAMTGGCKNNSTAPAEVPADTATLTPTATSTVTPMAIDNFEASVNPTDVNQQGGDWESSKNVSSTAAVTIEADGASSTTKSKKLTGDVIAGDTIWPYIAMATSLSPSAGAVDLSGTTGLKLYMKGTLGTGSSVGFLIQLLSTNVTDSSNWKYTWTPSGSWTQYTIPWTSFVKPSWGEGNALTLTQVLSATKALQWAVSDLTGTGTSSNTGNAWYIDQIVIY